MGPRILESQSPVLPAQKLIVLQGVIGKLGLTEIDKDGGNIAALIDDLVKRYGGESWEAELDKIVGSAEALITEGRLKEAMFYLGGIIAEIADRKLREADRNDLVVLAQTLRDAQRSAWNPDNKFIPSNVGNDCVPDWWTNSRMQEEGPNNTVAVVTKAVSDRVLSV